MSSAIGRSTALNVLRLKGHLSPEVTGNVLKAIYYSLRSIQDSCKRFIRPDSCMNLEGNSKNLLEHASRDLGHKQQYKHVNKIQYPIGMATGFCVKAQKINNMCIKRDISSEFMKAAQRTVHTVQGIDMSPHPKPKPKRKENPYAPEIPEQNPLPGLPMPAFPDVGIPIVPELPLPEVPEIPMPQEPGKAPKKKPSPGESDSQRKFSTLDKQVDSSIEDPLGSIGSIDELTSTGIKDIFSTLEYQNLVQIYDFIFNLQSQVQYPDVLVNRFYKPNR